MKQLVSILFLILCYSTTAQTINRNITVKIYDADPNGVLTARKGILLYNPLTNKLYEGQSNTTVWEETLIGGSSLPAGGTNGQVLSTDGSGVYSWVDNPGPLFEVVNDTLKPKLGLASKISLKADDVYIPGKLHDSGGDLGTLNQVLSTNADGTTNWINPVSSSTSSLNGVKQLTGSTVIELGNSTAGAVGGQGVGADFQSNRYQYLNGFDYEIGGSVNAANIRPVVHFNDNGDVWMGANSTSTANNQGVFFFDRSKASFNIGRNTNSNIENLGNFSTSIGISNLVSGNSSFASGNGNQATADFTTSQGFGGISSAVYATISGGFGGRALGQYSVVGGGDGNQALKDWSSVFSGDENISDANYASVLSGRGNVNKGVYASIVSGRLHYTDANESYIGGGVADTIIAGTALSVGQAILSGSNNNIDGTSDNRYSLINSGSDNTIRNAFYAAVLSGKDHKIGSTISSLCNYSAVFSGDDNWIVSNQAFLSWIGGGRGHRLNGVSAIYSLIGGGRDHVLQGDYSSILAGFSNQLYGNDAGVLGGRELISYARGEFTFGVRNTTDASADQINYTSNSILFSVGNGGADGIRSNAITVLKNGRTQINTEGYNSNLTVAEVTPEGALDVVSTTGAFIVPRMTTVQKNALPGVNGSIVYDTDLNAFQFYENGAWVAK